MNKVLIICIVFITILFFSYATVFALSSMYKQLAGLGNVEFVDQVQVTEIAIVSPTKIKTVIKSIISTEAGYVYKVNIYLDGVNTANQTVSWGSGQIPNIEKTLNFSGLSLGSVTIIGIEVIR